MCGTDSCNLPPAPESADLLAIIHPQSTSHSSNTPSRPTPHRTLSGRLRLSNAHTLATTSDFQSQQDVLPVSHGLLNFHIHRFGQPICEELENPILHSFSIESSAGSICLGRRLDLGIGGDGVLGRTVSVTDEFGGLLGQGVIGRM